MRCLFVSKIVRTQGCAHVIYYKIHGISTWGTNSRPGLVIASPRKYRYDVQPPVQICHPPPIPTHTQIYNGGGGLRNISHQNVAPALACDWTHPLFLCLSRPQSFCVTHSHLEAERKTLQRGRPWLM